ncbi:MAG: hypothetical protein ACLPN5_18595 [Roseiarcus sp.]
MTEEILSVALDSVEPIDGMKFVKAEWWNEASRFAVVLTRGPRGKEKLLRMDLNKQSFLDVFDDERLDGSLRARAHSVWEIIAKARNAPQTRESTPHYVG